MNGKKEKGSDEVLLPFFHHHHLTAPFLRSNSAWRRRRRTLFCKNNTNDKSFNFISTEKNCTQEDKEEGKKFCIISSTPVSYIFVIPSSKFSLWWIETLHFTLCLSLKMTQYWILTSSVAHNESTDNARNRQICHRERVFEVQFLLQFFYQFFVALDHMN